MLSHPNALGQAPQGGGGLLASFGVSFSGEGCPEFWESHCPERKQGKEERCLGQFPWPWIPSIPCPGPQQRSPSIPCVIATWGLQGGRGANGVYQY